MNLLDYCDDVAGILEEGDPVDVVFLDCQNALEKLLHKHIGRKLASLCLVSH